MPNRFAVLAPGSQVALLALVALVALVALTACDRRQASADPADTARAASSDTIVRRVVRVYRAPSAIQRVTGAVSTMYALRPLDSALAVRVLDQRGRELDGVRVSWTLLTAGDGSQLRVVNARTDSLGISRVAFTPGRTAIPQVVVAEVAGVGRISFTVSVAVASIRLTAEHRTVWSGDDESVSADLRDAEGVVLVGGPLAWATTDSTVLSLASSDAVGASVRAKRAGAADVVAWTEPGRVRGSLRLAVVPVVSGGFVTIDGKPVPSLTMTLAAAGVHDSVPVVNARFSKRVVLPTYPDVELRAAPVGPTSSHAVHLRITSARALQGLTIALVPTVWRIDAGTYTGREIPIDAVGALRRASGSAGFWRLTPFSGGAPPQLIGWPEDAPPIRIVFNHGRTRERITPEDSGAFWKFAEDMQRDLGARLFEPAELASDTVPAGVVTVEIGTDVAEGHTFVTWNEVGDIYDGVLMFHRTSTLRNAHVVTHELLHLLGFGHSRSFASVSRPTSGTEPRLTPEDVAYTQVAMRLRRLQRRTGARPGLPIASP